MARPKVVGKIRGLMILSITWLLPTLVSCERRQKFEACFDYPKQIDSLQVRDLYDTARIYIYTWLCDRKIDGYYRGQFELKYTSFFLRNDSLELFFTHFLPDGLKDSGFISDYGHRCSIAFDLKTKQKLWGWDINGFSDELQPGDARFESPASVEVKSFIRDHKNSLHPCFNALIDKTGILAE